MRRASDAQAPGINTSLYTEDYYRARRMPLILRHASVSRPSGQWSRSDYDVHDGEHRVGRIFRADVGRTEKTPWMWTIEFHQRRGAGPHHGLAASRDEAMAAFKTSWERCRS